MITTLLSPTSSSCCIIAVVVVVHDIVVLLALASLLVVVVYRLHLQASTKNACAVLLQETSDETAQRGWRETLSLLRDESVGIFEVAQATQAKSQRRICLLSPCPL